MKDYAAFSTGDIPQIEEKLRAKHDIEPAEVTECFYNRTKCTLIDTREEHKTKPPSE